MSTMRKSIDDMDKKPVLKKKLWWWMRDSVKQQTSKKTRGERKEPTSNGAMTKTKTTQSSILRYIWPIKIKLGIYKGH